jgi:Ca2+-binding EF-hand superfamily protein
MNRAEIGDFSFRRSARFSNTGVLMVSSIGSSAVFSFAMLSGSQSRGSRDMQALQEKLFTKLDANGDGGINKTELSEFMSFAAQSSGGQATTDSSALFSSLDSDGNGAISQAELSDGVKTLFDQLRTQLMTATKEASETTSVKKPDTEELFSTVDANGDGLIDQDELGSFMAANPPPSGADSGGGFSKLESLLDQYRSTAGVETKTSSALSIAA